MTCDEYRTWIAASNELGTRAERVAARAHNHACEPCREWSLSVLNEASADLVAEATVVAIFKDIEDILTTDPEA